MPEFRRNIGGPNLGSIPRVRAVKPVDTTGNTINAIAGLAQAGMQVYGRHKAREAGKQLSGAEESAVSVDASMTQATNELEMDVLLGGEGGRDLTGPELEDIKKAKFDEVLTSQKRLQSALSRGLISSTEANARMQLLRNEALSDPFMAMFQGDLDRALYPSATRGVDFFQATEAEKLAASEAKGRAEAAEEKAKAIAEIQASTGFNEQAAEVMWQKQTLARREAEELEAKTKAFNYNSKGFAAVARAATSAFADASMGIVGEFTKGEGRAEDIAPTIARLEQQKSLAKRYLSEKMRNEKGEVVGKGEDFDKAIREIDTTIDEYINLVKGDFSQAQILANKFVETQNANKLLDQQSLDAMFGANPHLAALMRSGSPAMVEFGLNLIRNYDSLKSQVEASGNPTFKNILNLLSGREVGKGLGGALRNTVEGNTENLPEEEKINTRNFFSAISITDQGALFPREAYGKGKDEEIDREYRKSPIALDQIAKSNAWGSALRTDPNAVRAVKNIISGAADRAISTQFISRDQGPVVKGGFGRFTTEENFGLPSSVKVKLVPRTATHIGPTYVIDSVSNAKLTDEYKKNLISTYKLGVAHEELWNQDFESVDEWINSIFTVGGGQEEAPEEAKEEGEGFSLISPAHGSELDPSEVDAGFPESESSEEEFVDISEGLYGRTAVHDLQKEVGVDEDGILGPKSKRAIRSKFGREEGNRRIKEAEEAQAVQFKEMAEDLTPSVAEKLGPHIAPEWIQAIWMHESDRGNKVLGGTYNLGNIKAKKGETFATKRVWEVLDGKDVMVDAKFRKFENFEEAAEAWGDFLQTPRYAKARAAKTFKEFTSELKKAGYATDPKWEKGVHAHLKKESIAADNEDLSDDLDKAEENREIIQLMSQNRNLTLQEMLDEGILTEEDLA